MKKLIITLFISLLFFLVSCDNENIIENEKRKLHISAAISLSEVLLEIKEMFEEEHDVSLTFHFGGSGKIAQQIEQGAPGDVYISANEEWMKVLVEKKLIDEETYTPITSNRLVFIKRKDLQLEHANMNVLTSDEIKQIAIAHPETVPAGYYTKMALENSQRWNSIQEKVIFAQDVRQVLTYVETGNAEVGFIYESDLLHSENVEVIEYIDESLYESIIYPGAVRTDALEIELGKEFLHFLTTKKAQEMFEKHGFSKLIDGD